MGEGPSDPPNLVAGELFPAVYDELKTLASRRLVNDPAGKSLNATALVHEAFMRLAGDQQFANRHHFFAAASESMRRILVDRARHRGRIKHGGLHRRQPFDEDIEAPEADRDPLELLALNEALEKLESASPRRAEVVKLRYFGGLTLPEIAGLLEISLSTAEADWTYARAWLKREMASS